MLMRCENCGAPQEFEADDQITSCEYCGQTNFVVRPGEARSQAAPEHCPGCGYGLFPGATSSRLIWGCGHCGGVWLDVATCKDLASDLAGEVFELAKRATANARARTKEPGVPRPCPVCDERMGMTPLPNHLTVDACRLHGTFFDAGELERVCASIKTAPSEPSKPRVFNHKPPTEAELSAFRQALKAPATSDGASVLVVGGFLLTVLAAAGQER